MSKKIDDQKLSEWYSEVLKHPSFVSELSEYEKEKLGKFAEVKKFELIDRLFNEFKSNTEIDVSLGIDVIRERFNTYLKTEYKYLTLAPIKVLNSLGYGWELGKPIFKIDKSSIPDNRSKLNDQLLLDLPNDKKEVFAAKQIAFLKRNGNLFS